MANPNFLKGPDGVPSILNEETDKERSQIKNTGATINRYVDAKGGRDCFSENAIVWKKTTDQVDNIFYDSK